MKWLVLTSLSFCCVAISWDTATAQPCEVLLDGVTNSCGSLCLIPQKTHDISFRITAPCLPVGVPYSVSGSLLIYSPDGAQWTFTEPGTLPAWDALWSSAFVKMYHKAAGSGEFVLVDVPVGPGSDSVAIVYTGVALTGEPGLYNGFNAPVWTIKIRTRPEDRGKHICLDTVAGADIPAAGYQWEWVSPGGADHIWPSWNGPHCFEILDTCAALCGDVDGNGIFAFGDFLSLQDWVYGGGDEPAPCAADVDGYLGVTNNDLVSLWGYAFCVYPEFKPNCQWYAGTSFPISNDVLELRNTTVPPGSSQAKVEVWLDPDQNEINALSLAFSYKSSDPFYTVTLQGKAEKYGETSGLLVADDEDGKGLLIANKGTSALPDHVSDLVFNISPVPTDTVHIVIDTTDYPPSHTTVLSTYSECSSARGVRPHFIAYGDRTVTPIGDADIDTVGDTLFVRNVGSTGQNGVRVPGVGSAVGTDMKFTDLDLSVENRSVEFDVFGRTDSRAELQRLSGVGVYQDTGGTIQVLADYTLIGDPNVRVKVYNGTVIAGEDDIVGGGIVAVGQDMGYGLPQIVGAQFRVLGDPTFIVEFSVPLAFKLTEGPTLYGNILHLVSTGATEEVVNFDRIDITGMNLVSFGLYDIDRTVCCVGMRGNVDCSPDDFVTMGDLTVLIDNLFITLTPLGCEQEGELDGTPPITMGDLTRMIDYLFITLTPLPACP
jgi:hypothetical protein